MTAAHSWRCAGMLLHHLIVLFSFHQPSLALLMINTVHVWFVLWSLSLQQLKWPLCPRLGLWRDSEVTLAPLCKFVSVFALHKYTVWKTFYMTRLVPVCRLHADNCKCCPLRSIYSAVTHQPQSSGGQRASLRMWMSSQKRRLITCNDTGQLMALLEQLY